MIVSCVLGNPAGSRQQRLCKLWGGQNWLYWVKDLAGTWKFFTWSLLIWIISQSGSLCGCTDSCSSITEGKGMSECWGRLLKPALLMGSCLPSTVWAFIGAQGCLCVEFLSQHWSSGLMPVSDLLQWQLNWEKQTPNWSESSFVTSVPIRRMEDRNVEKFSG